jgi:hypothetical protein
MPKMYRLSQPHNLIAYQEQAHEQGFQLLAIANTHLDQGELVVLLKCFRIVPRWINAETVKATFSQVHLSQCEHGIELAPITVLSTFDSLLSSGVSVNHVHTLIILCDPLILRALSYKLTTLNFWMYAFGWQSFYRILMKFRLKSGRTLKKRYFDNCNRVDRECSVSTQSF